MTETEAKGREAEVRPSAVDRLVEDLRDLVSRRGLRVGDALPTERELGEMFGAARNTVREALVVLRAYGMVETRPKVGAVLAGGQGEALRRLFSFHQGISPGGFRDVQGFRRLVEIGIGEEILKSADEAAFDALERVNDRILTAETSEARARADYEFHEALIALGHNRTTLATFRFLRPVIEDLMRVGKDARPVQANTHEAHREIVDALRSGDRIAYAYRMSRHLDYGLRFVPGASETG